MTWIADIGYHFNRIYKAFCSILVSQISKIINLFKLSYLLITQFKPVPIRNINPHYYWKFHIFKLAHWFANYILYLWKILLLTSLEDREQYKDALWFQTDALKWWLFISWICDLNIILMSLNTLFIFKKIYRKEL